MAFCPECGNQISIEAMSCPKCGKPLKQQQNKVDVLELKGSRDRDVAAILALLLGAFGVHKFYLNERGKGILFLVFFWTALPMILGIIDGVLLLTMKEEVFDYKYNIYP